MLGCERFELRDEDGVPAEVELGLDPLLHRREAELVEAIGLRAGPRLVGEVGERRPAPQRERLAQRLGPCGRVERGGLGEQPLEPCRVDGVRRHVEHVARRPRAQQIGAEDAAEAGNGVLERPDSRRRRPLAPELIDEPVDRDDDAGPHEQRREQRALLAPRQRDHDPPVVPNLERAEETELHRPFVTPIASGDQTWGERRVSLA